MIVDVDLALQWGRDLVIAEMPCNSSPCRRRFQLQWGRDLVIAEIIDLAPEDMPDGYASMGPRSGDRGNRVNRLLPIKDQLLQWGRDLVIAEIMPNAGPWELFVLLQWGRDLVIAEMTRLSESIAEGRRASMGPRSGDRGNPSRGQWSCGGGGSFNGAAIW